MPNFPMSPVLLIGHSRPQLLEKQIQRLLITKRVIFLFIDGPRSREDMRVQETIEMARKYSVNTQIQLNLQERNLGCKWGPITAIDWAFKHTDSLIILEDDIEFSEYFLQYSDWALAKFANEKNVQHINGFNPMIKADTDLPSVFLSRHVFGWGWATWRDRWISFDSSLEEFENRKDLAKLISQNGFQTNKLFEKKWWTTILRCKGGHDAWDYQWTIFMWVEGRRAITPRVSLTRHVGIGQDATHFKSTPERTLDFFVRNFEYFPLEDVIQHYASCGVVTNPKIDFEIDSCILGFSTEATFSAFLQNFKPRLRRYLKSRG